jgi:hypothetical protein
MGCCRGRRSRLAELQDLVEENAAGRDEIVDVDLMYGRAHGIINAGSSGSRSWNGRAHQLHVRGSFPNVRDVAEVQSVVGIKTDKDTSRRDVLGSGSIYTSATQDPGVDTLL